MLPDLNWHLYSHFNFLFVFDDVRNSSFHLPNLCFRDDIWNFNLDFRNCLLYLVANHCLLDYSLNFQNLLDFHLNYFLTLSHFNIFNYSIHRNLPNDFFTFIDRHCFLSDNRHLYRSLDYSINNNIPIHINLNCLFGCNLHWHVVCDGLLHWNLDNHWNFFVNSYNLQLFFTQDDMTGFVDGYTLLESLSFVN